MLKLIYGPSGSGKTTELLQSICSDIQQGIRSFLLVPEQQAYISEMDILASLPANAGLYFEIVNFSGLAEDVFREYGGVTGSTLDAGTKALLMWDSLRTLAPVLSQYGKSAKSDMTLTSMMMATVDELKMAGIDSQKLCDVAKALGDNPALQKKLNDIAAVQELYSHQTQRLTGEDSADKLMRMAEKLCRHSYFQGCNLYIDSFTSFTAQEYSVIKEILRQAKSVTVSLCTDHPLSNLPHFGGVSETARRLFKIAAETNVNVEKKILSNAPSRRPKTLKILERDLWKFDLAADARTKPPMGETDALTMTVCSNLYEESENVALRILELVQNGMNYGDIAIVARDAENYRGVIDAAMERYKIPYFISERTDLSAKPLSRLILSALQCVDKHYRVHDVISLLKTGLTGVDRREAALFEEYCETWHISGSRFLEDVWSMNPDGLTTVRSVRSDEILEAANRVRRQIITPLQILASDLRASTKISDRCRAVYDYMQRLNLSEQLTSSAQKAIANGNSREAGESLRLYSFAVERLSQMVQFLPDANLTIEELIAALTLLFTTSDIGSVPSEHDCVIIGSANTLRVEKIKAAFLIGLCEGDFPKSISDDGVLSNADKETLFDFGIVLNSAERIQMSEELFYVYRAMTKPSERLYLSTVTAQPDGTTKTPSLAFTRVRFLLDRQPEEFDLDAVRRTLDGEGANAEESNLYVPPFPEGSTLRLSQSKINAFLQCPYRYYTTYTLKLRDKKDANPTYSDDGTFLHYVFEHFLRSALQRDKTLRLPKREEIPVIVDAILKEYLFEICPLPLELMDGRLLHLFSRLRRLALRMLENMMDELAVSKFVPTYFEKDIGAYDENGLPPFVIELKNNSRVLLTGKVDRIDLLECDGHLYFRVVDYKSGKHEFSLKDVKSGNEVQLVLYLFAFLASNPGKLVPAGAEYLYSAIQNGHATVCRSGFILNEDALLEAADASDDCRFTADLIKQSADEIQQLSQEMKEAVGAVAERILSGDAQKTPSEKACAFCPVRNNCDKVFHK